MGIHISFPQLAGLAAVASALSSPAQPVPIPLRVSTEIALPSLPAAILSPVPGNHGIYMEYASREGPEPAIRWVSDDGQSSIVYNLQAVPRSPNRQGWGLLAGDFAPIPGGGVAALGVWHDADGKYRGDSIIAFDQRGSPRNIIDLSDAIAPEHIASFGDGTFLVLGGVNTGTGLSTSEIHLVDAHGMLLARHVFEKLDSPESPPAHDHSPSGEKTGHPPTEDNAYPNTQAFQLYSRVAKTALVAGDDANVYIFPTDQAGKLFVVNEGGEVTQLALDPVPELENKNIMILGAIEHAGQLAIYYGVLPTPLAPTGLIRPTAKFLCLYDVHLGALQTTYQVSDPAIGNLLSGFDTGKFYFLSLPKDPLTHLPHAAILVAEP